MLRRTLLRVLSLLLVCLLPLPAQAAETVDLGVPQIGSLIYAADSMNLTVYWVQTQLKALGYYTQPGDELTGLMGSLTVRAITDFERDIGLSQDGVISQRLLDMIASVTAARGLRPVSVPMGGYYDLLPVMSAYVSRKQQNAPACRVLQTMLRALGFYTQEIDGVFDEAVEDALYRWETQHGWEKQPYKLGIARAILEEYVLWGYDPGLLSVQGGVGAIPVFAYEGVPLADAPFLVYGRTGPSAGQFNAEGKRVSPGFSDERLNVPGHENLRVFYLVAGLYDSSATWAYIEFSYHGESYRIYTTRLKELGIDQLNVGYVAERSAGTRIALRENAIYTGPGLQYAWTGFTLARGAQVTVYYEEDGYVMFDYSPAEGGLVRGWAPRDCLQ